MIFVKLVELIKQTKIKGRARIIKALSLLSNDLKKYKFKKDNYKTDIVLDLSDNTAISLYLKDGIPHEKGLLKIFTHFENSELNFWDIGTNYGYYPWVFTNENLFNKIYCFEPNQKLINSIKSTFKKQTEKVFIHNIGLGEKEEEIIFNTNKNRSDLGSFTNASSGNNTEKHLMKINTIDNLCNTIDKPDVIKIDVEGYELNVLKGYGTLNSDYPIITLEWINNFQDTPFNELLALFDNSWHHYFVGNDGYLYNQKNEVCSNDVLFISRKNKYFEKVSEILND